MPFWVSASSFVCEPTAKWSECNFEYREVDTSYRRSMACFFDDEIGSARSPILQATIAPNRGPDAGGWEFSEWTIYWLLEDVS